MEKIIVSNGGCDLEMLWFMGWLFTIGYLRLPLGKSILAIIVWPFYLGIKLRGGNNIQVK